MAVYKNGLAPRSAMKTFRNTGKYGHPDFIGRLDAAFTAVKNELGVNLSIASGQDIFRDYEGQVYWKNYWTRAGRPGNAAKPGESNHGLGVCADITGNGSRGTSLWNKVAAIFARYNLHFTVASESWHVQDMNISVAGNVVTINTPANSAYSGNRYFPTIAAFAAVQGGYRAMGYDIAQDGQDGPKTRAAVGDFQAKHGLKVDQVHGPATEKALIAAVAAKQAAAVRPPAPAPAPAAAAQTGAYGIGDVRGLQKIAKLNGYTGRIDNVWGDGSRQGFEKFLRGQGGMAAWLRKRWGYVGNDVFGPNMRAALKRASDANYKAL